MMATRSQIISISWRMWDERNMSSFLLQPDDDVPELLRPSGPAPQGFIQEKEVRVVDQSLGQPDPLQHPAGELAQLEVAGFFHPDKTEQAGDLVVFLLLFQSEELGVEIQELRGREVIIKIRIFRQVSEPLFSLGRKGGMAE